MKNSCKLKHKEMKNPKKFKLSKLFIGRILLIIILVSKELLSIIKKMVSGCKEMKNFYKLNHKEMKSQKKFKLLKLFTGKILLTIILDSKEQLSIIKKMVSGCKEIKNFYKLNHKEMKSQKKFKLLKLFTGKILLTIILDSKEQLFTIKKMVFGCKKMMSFYKLNQLKNQLLSIPTDHQKKFKLLKVKLGEIFITVAIQ